MNEREEIKKINTWLSFYFIQFDTSPPALIEGRVHPIQFSNSVTRINAAGRSFREKKLFLGIMLWLALVIIIVYPFLDTDYFLPVILIFGSLLLVDYIYYSILQTKTASLLLDIVQQENELFEHYGMRLRFDPYVDKLEMEVVPPESVVDSSPPLVQVVPTFRTMHESYGSQSVYDSAPSSRRSSTSSALVDIEPLSGYESTPTLLRAAMSRVAPKSPTTRLVDAAFIAKNIIPSATPAKLVDTDVTIIEPNATTTTTATAGTIEPSSYIDPDMPEGIALSPPEVPIIPQPTKNVQTAPIARRSALSSSDATSIAKKRGRRVSISDDICVFNEREHGRGFGHLSAIREEGSGEM